MYQGKHAIFPVNIFLLLRQEYSSWKPNRSLHKVMKVNPTLCWRIQNIEYARARNPFQKELQKGNGTNPRERSIFWPKKAGKVETFEFDWELEDSEFELLVLVWLWPNISSLFFHYSLSGMIIYILCQC